MPADLDHDPRVFFAAERTLLAWVRTGLGLVGMGFVVAKFGLFIRILHAGADPTDHAWVVPIGIALALLGAIASGVASWQHRRFCATLTTRELPRNYRVAPGLALGYSVALAGLILALVIVL
jgi:inner membrane protein YidH